MKLFYRGHAYEPNGDQPSNSTRHLEAPVQLKYRGIPYILNPDSQTVKATVPQAAAKLTYRGSAYLVASATASASVPQPVSVSHHSIVVPQPSIARRYYNKVHRANILQSLQRRIQVARKRGDQALIQLLEAEFRQIA